MEAPSAKDDIKMMEISVSSVSQLVPTCTHIDDDLLLLGDFAQMPWPTSPRRMKCLLMGLCLKGKAQYSVDTEEHMVKPNDVIIINEGTVVDNGMFSHDFNGVAILMSHDFIGEAIKGIHELSQLFLFSRTHPVFTLGADESQGLQHYFHAIEKHAANTAHHFRKELVQSYIMTMIYDISNTIWRLQQTSDRRQTRAEAIFAQFIRLVDENFRSERRVGWYAEQLCITPKYLSETVKTVSRRTPNEWIDNYVILEVRVLLKNSTLSIKEIAQRLNFPNQSFLGKFFKEHMGLSPSDYRKS
ncbi:MAG: AraC family transcriptional regulator [Prevotella sp.]|nr:AraC family transcriptional regulator [Prevotella sp.]